jgi:hypothetical protein
MIKQVIILGGGSAGFIARPWQAVGACAVAWQAAAGTFALAHDFAVGTIAHALQVNNAAAKNFFATDNFCAASRHSTGIGSGSTYSG